MEFQVSARKWRPQKFAELVGQEAIVQTLKNAVALDRVAHAYLFSGTRGVGKTTLARIYAKTLNCVEGPGEEPCDVCENCVQIREGACLDVREIDGASNNGVDEIRDLIENIQYGAVSCRYKVYIIDEIHMLSKSAFNALLKTLEEPPARTLFIFATTELNKIPETILSRCQWFEFKPLNQTQIVRQLQLICEKEGIQVDEVSLEAIAKNGFGSMRDAQSMLDQAIAYCGKDITQDSVETALGIVGRQDLERFINGLIAKQADALIAQIQEAAGKGKDLILFCRDLAEYVRNLAFVKISKNPESILGAHRELETLKKQAEAFDEDELKQFFMVLARTEADMRRSALSQMIFEMSVLRLTDARPYQKIDEMIQTLNRMEPPAAAPAEKKKLRTESPATESVAVPQKQKAPESAPPPSSKAVEEPQAEAAPATAVRKKDESSHWEEIRRDICGKKPFFESILEKCQLVKLTSSELHLQFFDAFSKELAEGEDYVDLLKKSAKSICDFDVAVQLTVGPRQTIPTETNLQDKDAQEAYNNEKLITENEIIQDALEIFGGVVKR